MSPVTLPDRAWTDLTKHAFAKELMTRPGGIYPKYGAVDRDYGGSEYDAFQDIFTSAIYTNMEWGRLETAKLYIDNYFTDFVDSKGMIDMRGPETAQFGMTLSLLARYFNYSGDTSLLLKHRAKIEAMANLLADMHDESLSLPQDHAAHGLIRGWSESDSCLMEDPSLYWQAYYANSAFAARGFNDITKTWTEVGRNQPASGMEELAADWSKLGQTLRRRTVESVEKNIQRDKTPPYIGLFPGTTLTFRESLQTEKPSPQQWPHRAYAELLQADVLPAHLANLVIDCMRAYGATTVGVVANGGESTTTDARFSASFLTGTRKCCSGWTASKSSCYSSTRIAITATRAGVGRPARWQALLGTRRCTAFPRNKPFRSSHAGCWYSKILTKTGSTWPRAFHASGWCPERRSASSRPHAMGPGQLHTAGEA